VIDALSLSEPSTRSARPDLVTLLHALEGRGVSVVIVEESLAPTSFVPFVADIVFQLAFREDANAGQLARSVSCTKSRYATARSGTHVVDLERGRAVMRSAALAAHSPRRA
jgi:hypothetical protein